MKIKGRLLRNEEHFEVQRTTRMQVVERKDKKLWRKRKHKSVAYDF